MHVVTDHEGHFWACKCPYSFDHSLISLSLEEQLIYLSINSLDEYIYKLSPHSYSWRNND